MPTTFRTRAEPDGPAPPAALVDALLSYAIDPSNWEGLLVELDESIDRIDAMAPTEFLMHLSRAEALAWQIGNDPEADQPLAYAYVILDPQDRVLSSCGLGAELAGYLNSIAPGDRFGFAHADTQAAWADGLVRLTQADAGHVLLEIHEPHGAEHRFGYLVGQANLPAALKAQHPDGAHALLIAQEQPSDALRHVVQASFGLTTAEAALTLKLATGQTLKECSEALGISVNTARNQLQAVFSKTGVKRQPDLILVVTQLSVILASTGATADNEPAATEPDEGDYPQREFMIMPGGRRVSFRTYGDPAGRPVMYLHETFGGSRLVPGTDHLATSRGLWIIAPERPGVGFSEPMPDASFADAAADAERLLDHLGISRVTLLGFIAGGAYALAIAAALGPRVSDLWLVAARPPRPEPEPADDDPGHLATVRARLVRQPWMIGTFFNILRNRASQALNRRILRRVYGAVPADLRLLKARPAILEHMAAYTRESMTVSTDGIISDLRCLDEAPPLDPQAIHAAIHVWHGDADTVSRFEHLRAFLDSVQADIRIFEGEGSLILYAHWPELLREISETRTGV